MRKRDNILGDYLGTNCPQVEMMTGTGKMRNYWATLSILLNDFSLNIKIAIANFKNMVQAVLCAKLAGLKVIN